MMTSRSLPSDGRERLATLLMAVAAVGLLATLES
jgi:hypothetical protein